jgi:hypothetical protein
VSTGLQKPWVIRANVNAATVRAAVRSHLRSPLAELAWQVGLTEAPLVVGFVARNYFYARAIPPDTEFGRLRDSLALRGCIVGRQDGGCDIRVWIRGPYLIRWVIAVVAGVIFLVCLVAFVKTSNAGLLVGAAFIVAMRLVSVSARRMYQDNESRERRLLETWLDELEWALERESLQA